MTRAVTSLSQGIIVVLGLSTLAFLLWEPHVEGRNTQATTFDIYFRDPFLAYVYLSSAFYFAILYQTHRILGNISPPKEHGPAIVRTLRTVHRCALVLLALAIGAMLWVLISGDQEDQPPGLFMSSIVAGFSLTVALVSAHLARRLQGLSDQAPPTEP